MTMPALARAASGAAEAPIADEIAQLGCCGPIPLLSSDECAALDAHFNDPDLVPPLGWTKGHAVTDRTIYDIATRPGLIAILKPLLGENIVLWAARIVHRPPGNSHPWHTDMESAAPDSRVVSVWIGIRNASRASGLVFIAGSHRFGRSVQEVLAGLGEQRDELPDARMVEIARAIDPSAHLVQPDVGNGGALLFDGRAWHSGRNDAAAGARIALLLQYAAADTPIPMPAGAAYRWPFRFATDVRVPAILVSGLGRNSANLLVPPPPAPRPGLPMITTFARSVTLPLAEDPVKRWRPYRQFRGPTGTFTSMSCHISVLSTGHHPHPPHIHPEEELLIVLDGEVEIELADDPSGTNSRMHAMKPGMFSYYPATQHHTIHNTGAGPATYLMFKWSAPAAGSETPLETGIFEYEAAVIPAEPAPMAKRVLFQQATQLLGKLHAHLTTLQPGAGYEPHADPYDVAIVLLSGEVETVGERIRPLGVVYYSAGELHGMRNVGATPATYLVFEFHSPSTVALRQRRLEERRRAHQAERQRRKLEKQRRKRGLRGLVRKVRKFVTKRLGR
jgi:quercetin dioxygenase-like cupin family protein